MTDELPFLDRARAFLAEAEGNVVELEQRKAALLAERDAEVVAVRERYRERIAEIDAAMQVVHRVARALEPSTAKPARKRSETRPRPEVERPWTPSEDYLNRCLVALVRMDDAGSVPDLVEVIEASGQTVRYSLDALRETGLIRLAGQNDRGARLYRPTPAGEAKAAELNGAHA